MMRCAPHLVLFVWLAGAAACTTAEAPGLEATGRQKAGSEARLERARAVVAGIEGRLMAFRRVEGTWREGETAGGFAAFLDAGRVARIDERLEDEDGTRSRVRYYYDGPALVHYTRDGDAFLLSAFFDLTGDVIHAEKRVGDHAAPLSPEEVRAILHHAGKLLIQAEAAAAR
jgi:hypothetical protein